MSNSIFLNTHTRKRVAIFPIEKWGFLPSWNEDPSFDIVTYSYDGSDYPSGYLKHPPVCHIRLNTEFWGQSLYELISTLVGKYEVYAFFNGDIFINFSNINQLFTVGDLYRLDFFQAALSHDSYGTHQHLFHKPSVIAENVPFIEIMMPCLTDAVLRKVLEIKEFSISGWGMDVYLFKFIELQYHFSLPAVVHVSMALHAKPIESGNIIFSNGLNALQEMEHLRLRLLSRVEKLLNAGNYVNEAIYNLLG